MAILQIPRLPPKLMVFELFLQDLYQLLRSTAPVLLRWAKLNGQSCHLLRIDHFAAFQFRPLRSLEHHL